MNFWCRTNAKPKNICNNHHLISEKEMVFYLFILFYFLRLQDCESAFHIQVRGEKVLEQDVLDVTGMCRNHVKEVCYLFLFFFFFESTNGRHCASDYRTFLFSNKVFQLNLAVFLSMTTFLTWHLLQNFIKISRTFC